MRKLMVIAIQLITYSALAQQPSKIFFGDDYQKYHKAFLQIDTAQSAQLIGSFFADYGSCKAFIDGTPLNVSLDFTQEIDTLAGRYFLVDRITARKEFVPNNNVKEAPVIFVLKDTLANRDYFFLYNKKDEQKFAFYANPPVKETVQQTTETSEPKPSLINEQPPIVLTGDYKQDILIIAAGLDLANKQDYVIKMQLEKYRKSQITGYSLIITGTLFTLFSSLVIEDPATLTGFVAVGSAVNLTGLIILINGHKHLRIK